MVTLEKDSFLRFVRANLDQPCHHDKEQAWDIPVVASRCTDCSGTGQIPRPEAVELYDMLMVVDDISGVVVPRSEAEQHVALEEWLRRVGRPAVSMLYGSTYRGLSLRTAAREALVASGWADTKETSV